MERQLNNMKNPDNVPGIYPIGCQKILAHIKDPKLLSDNDLPAIAFKLGSRVENKSITSTTSYKGYTYSIAVHATVAKSSTESLKDRSLKMMESMDIIASALRHITADDGSSVENCRIPLVDNLFKDILTTRDYLIFQFAFDLVERL